MLIRTGWSGERCEVLIGTGCEYQMAVGACHQLPVIIGGNLLLEDARFFCCRPN